MGRKGDTGRVGGRLPGGYDETHLGASITPEAVLFGKAMHRLRQLLGRTPTAAETFRAAKAMGYRRPPA